MAWVLVPKEHHPLFLEAIPTAPDVDAMAMFGGIAIAVNGNIAAGLFGRSVMLRLSDADSAIVLGMEGGAYFDPMGRGAKMAGKVMLPEETMHDRHALRSWLEKAVALARSLPPKKRAAAKTKATKSSAKTAATKNAAARQAGRKKKAATKKAATKTSTTAASRNKTKKKR